MASSIAAEHPFYLPTCSKILSCINFDGWTRVRLTNTPPAAATIPPLRAPAANSRPPTQEKGQTAWRMIVTTCRFTATSCCKALANNGTEIRNENENALHHTGPLLLTFPH